MLAAVLGFQPTKLEIRAGGVGEVKVVADSRQVRVIGVDVILEYDPTKLEIVKVEDSGVFATASARLVDNRAGVVKLAYSNSRGEYDRGKIDLARIGVRLKSGQKWGDLAIKYIPGSTTDSNIVTLHGVDVLTEAGNLTVTAKGRVLAAETAEEVTIPAVEVVKPIDSAVDLSWMWMMGVALVIVGAVMLRVIGQPNDVV